jgi:hypothetical protein
MKILNYKPEGYLPGIILDKDSGKFEISGKACPEDAIEFYDPVFDWIDEYSSNPLEETIFDFKLTYYNTVSSKILMMIMMRLEEISEEGHNIKIRWYYPEDDEDMQEAGEDFEGMLEMDFELIAYDEEDDSDGSVTDNLIDSIL